MRYAKLAFALLGLAALLIAVEPVVSKNSIALKTQVFAGLLVCRLTELLKILATVLEKTRHD